MYMKHTNSPISLSSENHALPTLITGNPIKCQSEDDKLEYKKGI